MLQLYMQLLVIDNCKKEAWKKFRPERDSNPRPDYKLYIIRDQQQN